MESNTGPAPLQRSPPRQPEADGCSNTQAADPTTAHIDCLISPSPALLPPLCEWIMNEDGHAAAAVASPPGATHPPPSPQLLASNNILEEKNEEEEWEISKIIGKRRARRFMNTRCAGRVHGYRGARWKMPSGCCRSLRYNFGHSRAPSLEYRSWDWLPYIKL